MIELFGYLLIGFLLVAILFQSLVTEPPIVTLIKVLALFLWILVIILEFTEYALDRKF